MNIKHRNADFYALQYKIAQEEAASIAAAYNRCADTLFNDDYYYGAYVGMVIILYAQGRLSLKYKEMLLNEVIINAHYFTASLANKQS